MKHASRFALAVTAVMLWIPAAVHGHFNLIAPAATLVQNERGDPQKAGPCGGSNTDWGKRSGIVTKVTGGSDLHVKIQETIYHPGFYRIALAVNSPTDLPLDPEAETKPSERGPLSVSGKMAENAVPPVLKDGLFLHHERPAAGTQLPPWEIDVTLPNINCKKCTLQVIQFMEDHVFNNPGGFTYHHCAELEIKADPKKFRTLGWPAETE